MKSTADHFNTIAKDYDKFKSRNSLYYKTLKKAVKNEITISKPTILDIGCATGSVLKFLNPEKGFGIDVSKKMISIAKKNSVTYKNLQFITFNIEKKPFKKAVYDYILFNDVIEHVQNQKMAVKNISLSMSKKTILILSMANPLWEPLLLVLEKLKLKMPEGPHNRISEKSLLTLLKDYKLEVISKKIYFPKLSIFSNLGLIYVYTIKKKIQ